MYTMLVADDEKWIRERIISSINWAKIGVSIKGEAAEGEEALELCRKIKPDIILTDIRMPGINGLDFLKTLNEEGSKAKVIIISGYGDFEYAQRAIKLGVLDYILKPVENTELVNIVKKCIRHMKAEAYKNRIVEQAAYRKNLTEKLAVYAEKGPAMGKRNTLAKAVTFIEDNYNRPISLSDVSDTVMLNPSYFSKLFKESIGLSFNKYLTQYRIHKAKELMKDPTLRVKEIAALVGYENVRYFIRVFKSATGFSPYTYKEQL